MSNPAAATLEELARASEPAWLWDGARCRIVWANPAGLAVFGADTLFDLIDRPFDPADPGVGRINELVHTLGDDEVVSEELTFVSAAEEATFNCTLRRHRLADGRPGVLVATRAAPGDGPRLPAGLMVDLLEAMPLAIVVCDAAGEVAFANAGAREMFADSRLDRLDDVLGEATAAGDLLARTVKARTYTTIDRLHTALGERDIRMTARRVDEPGDDGPAILIMLEDVTDRRALERQFAAPPPPTSADEPPAKGDRSPAPPTPPASALANEQPAGDMAVSGDDDTPELVARRLDAASEAIVLHRDGSPRFANRAFLAMFALTGVADLKKHPQLMAAINDCHDGDTIETAAGTMRVSHDAFPWLDGLLTQSTLVPLAVGDDGDDDDNVGDGGEDDRVATVAAEPAIRPVPPAGESDTAVADAAGDGDGNGVDDDEGPQPFGLPGAEELRAIIDTASDGVVILDRSGKITGMSAGGQSLFGHRLEEVAGKPFTDLFSPSGAATVRDYLAALGEGGISSVFNGGREVVAIARDGGEVPLFLTVTRLAGKGADDKAVFAVVMRDMTQWKKTEAELRAAKEAAEQANAQKSEFLANISHELRTPLNAILGFSDVMRQQRFGEIANDKYLAYANDIHQSGSHLLSLINDLLDLSKVEAGKLELNFASVNLAAVVDECIRVLTEEATAHRVVVRKAISPGLPNVVADLRAMKQIVLNLVSNAIKFTDPGGQVIISLKLTKAGEMVLRVKDTGLGMDEGELRAAMQPFRRIKREGGEEIAGTGLGLPLTKALAEANRASFEISSARGQGTLVEITFPTTRVLAD